MQISSNNAELFSIEQLRNEYILVAFQSQYANIFAKQMVLKIRSVIFRPFCAGLNFSIWFMSWLYYHLAKYGTLLRP